MTIIIIDHHPIDLHKISKSADVLINWHNCDFEETCACGEVYHFIRGIRWLTKKVNPIEFLTYASMGILADVSPIIGDNRVIIKNGLKQFALSHVTGAGLNALLRKSRIYTSNVSQEDILFKIAPKINAAGRLAHPDIAFKLLIEQDVSKCEDMAENLTEYNDKRKDIQKKMEDEAVAMVNANKDKFKHGILLYSPNWLTGVVGIVASKMVEKFHVPAILIGQNDGMLKGSGRSLENINLKQIMDDCNEIFEHYGGHPLAAGASLKKEHINDANDKFNEACERYYKIHGYPRSIRYYDYELLPKHITPKATKKLLETMYPYCEHFNPEPVFLLKDVTLVNVGMREDKNKAWRIISFNVEKDGIKSMIKMKMFNNTLGTEIEGLKADIYFSFPQSIERNDFGYDPTINVLDIVIKKG
jgi:single-stranded-DNA-specific exonuclease